MDAAFFLMARHDGSLADTRVKRRLSVAGRVGNLPTLRAKLAPRDGESLEGCATCAALAFCPLPPLDLVAERDDHVLAGHPLFDR